MTANITLAADLRQKLERLARPDKTADDLANEVLSWYVSRREAAQELTELSQWGQEQSRYMRHSPADVLRAIAESRQERRAM